MKFKEALQKLGIEEYAERIFSSNSHGELFHLQDYFLMADHFEKSTFAPIFKAIVKEAEETWERPESVFQHILGIINQSPIKH